MGIAALSGLAFSLVVVSLSPALHASPSARLVYAHAADVDGCPSEMELRLGVTHRLGYDPFEYGARLTVIALIERGDRGFAGNVEIINEEGVSEGRRSFESPSDRCTDLVRAMALSVSIALEQRRQAETSAEPSRDEEAGNAAEREGDLVPARPRAPSRDEPVMAAQSDPTRLRFGVGTGAQLTMGTAPAPAPGLSLAARVRKDAFRLDAEVRLDGAVSAPLSEVGPSSRFEASVISVSAVPCLQVGMAFGCGVASLGSMAARASGITAPGRDRGLYSAAGGRAGLSVPVSESVSLELLGEGVLQLARPEVSLGQDVVWRQPLVAAGLGARVFGTIP